MQPYNIALTQSAKRDLLNIKYYIKYQLLSKQASDNFENAVYRKFDTICNEPHIYQQEYFGKYIYRKAIVNRYIIAFRVDEQTHTVYIIAIGHSLQKRKNIVKH